MRLKEKHPLAIRWFHWISFPLLFLMIWSGLLVYWSNDLYRVGWGSHTLVHFFLDWFYQQLNIPQRLAEGMALHFFFMWLFVLNGVIYSIYLAVSGEWRNLLPDRRAFREAVLVTLHDLHLRKEPPPQGLYNGAQRIAYTGVIILAMGSVVTGFAIYKPAQLSWLARILGGYPMARWEHFWLMCAFVGFFAIHIIQVLRAGWDNLRSMVAGSSIAEDGEEGMKSSRDGVNPERSNQQANLKRYARSRTRRAFLALGLGAAAGYGGWAWLRSRPEEEGEPWPLRSVLRDNERVARSYFSDRHLSPSLLQSQVDPKTRENGDIGLGDDFRPENWSLNVRGPGDSGPSRVTMAQIRALPRVAQITQLNCIEGWTVAVHWTGARFSDFTDKYARRSRGVRYVGMQTPDEAYFVGLDAASAMHVVNHQKT